MDNRILNFLASGLLASSTIACASGTPKPDGTYTSPICKSDAEPISLDAGEEYGKWHAVALPGAQCADGSQYKFFVQYNEGATDLTLSLQPGGGCWDYESCTGQYGMLNAVNLEGGFPDDEYMTRLDPGTTQTMVSNRLYPEDYGLHRGGPEHAGAQPWATLLSHLGQIDNEVATNLYNHVFFPYCTGDAFTGNTTNTYQGPNGENLVMHHFGRKNLEIAAAWLSNKFPESNIGQLLIVGASAGSLGAQVNYTMLRDAIEPKCSALVADSGLLFPEGGPQQPMRDLVTEVWSLGDLQTRIERDLIAQENEKGISRHQKPVTQDWGNLTTALPHAYPRDRFLFSAFRKDLNFSGFSYAVFFDNPTPELMTSLWQGELENYTAGIETEFNAGYYIADFRPDNCSHVLTMPPVDMQYNQSYVLDGLVGGADGYFRTEIDEIRSFPQADGSTIARQVHLGDAIRQLLDPLAPIPRMKQGETGAWFSTDREAVCGNYGILSN